MERSRYETSRYEDGESLVILSVNSFRQERQEQSHRSPSLTFHFPISTFGKIQPQASSSSLDSTSTFFEEPNNVCLDCVAFRFCWESQQSRSSSSSSTFSSQPQAASRNSSYFKKVVRRTILMMGVIPSNTAILSHQLEAASLSGMLVLTNRGITTFPIKVLSLQSSLRLLDLSANNLSSIPQYIGELSQLKSLFLNQNRLVALPEQIVLLQKLEFLSVAYNFLEQLPNDFAKLQNLRELKLSGNRLHQFPEEVIGMKNLRLLDLSLNEIVKIEDSLHGFQNFKVSDLNLNENHLTEITPELSRSPNLSILRLQNNRLSLNAIPERLLAESKVIHLLLDGNKFEIAALKNLDGFESYMERKTLEEEKSVQLVAGKNLIKTKTPKKSNPLLQL